MTMYGLLVGAHFRPPAKLILSCLRAGTPLTLRAEPDNPYDEEAVAVWLQTEELVGYADSLRDEMAQFGRSLDEVISQEEIQLGYLAREGNRDLGRLEGLRPAKDFFEGNWKASLQWGPNGEALVRMEAQEEASNASS